MSKVAAVDWSEQRRTLGLSLRDAFFSEALFDAMPDIVFFVKDDQGKYIVVNQTLVRRCGLREKSALLGRTVAELFPGSMAAAYSAQDQSVLRGSCVIRNQLELHLYPNRTAGWCMTQKIPLYNHRQHIIGVAGISRDLAAPDNHHPVYAKIAAAVAHLHQHVADQVSMATLVHLTGLSVSQLERYFQKIFSLTPRQMMMKIRLDAAAKLLAESADSITEIAQACGYQDHSAFSRVFKATVGMTPTQYRDTLLER
ncbi:helix-turn-helix domain-containing protein [Undibacterium sp. SXout7W]|uniref:AraC family transcriptional regulator n=1 Tax=Undibacterium sp. SXout7W TaxID=3413049 RepID=UPI003BF3235B